MHQTYLHGKLVHYTNEEGLNNIVENLRQLHSCIRNQDTLIAIVTSTNHALVKSEELNAVKDSIISNKDLQLANCDQQNQMLAEDNDKLKTESKLWKWISAGALVLGYVLGTR